MNDEQYQKAALRTMANQATIRERMYNAVDKTGKAHVVDSVKLTQLDNAARGMAGDVGEVNTCVQQCLEYGKQLDTNNLLAELGDVQWRIIQICDAMGWSLAMVFKANIAKLSERYPDAYSDFLADENNRDRPAEDAAVDKCLVPPVATMTCSAIPIQNGELTDAYKDQYPGHEVIEAINKALSLGFEIKDQCLVAPEGNTFHNKAASWKPVAYKGQKLRIPHWIDAAIAEQKENVNPTDGEAHNGYDRLCKVCKLNRVHKHNQACTCPDCYSAEASRQGK